MHAADAKKDYMLMEVVGHSLDGFVKAKYIHPGHFEGMAKRVLKFRSVDLLNPANFGIQINRAK